MVIRIIEPSLIRYITDRNMWVLRRKNDNVALNVSYSIDGLKWTSNKLGRALMFKRAFISNGRIVSLSKDGMLPSDAVYVEKFSPENHSTEAAQVAEYLWLNKALKMCY